MRLLDKYKRSQDVTVSHGTRDRRLEDRKLGIFRIFFDVADLYGQIYVVKDIASRMRPTLKPHQVLIWIKPTVGREKKFHHRETHARSRNPDT